jgi:hypothetical protein
LELKIAMMELLITSLVLPSASYSYDYKTG